ncbi:response regulator transcription factor [Clostridium sp. YIM B02506]|uniref:response regulator transcription factor n=1 Tax=Clostridium sp. YIM B02506 TaxID=2910680 RepID=UPI001EEE5D5B|nr:response regulator transcription factor [Clostridium sp. YIM B02506]
MEKYNVLVVDDEVEITDAIQIYLENEGYKVFKAYDGLDALDTLNSVDIHLIIMDIMMPKLDGMRATLKIRENKNIPIIMLSAKSRDTDKILGLNMGADDYITKPFNPLELIARVKSQLRRYVNLGNYGGESKEILRVGSLYLNKETKEFKVDEEDVKITPLEFKILTLLMDNPGRVFPIEEIYERVWNEPSYNADTVTVHIRRIREKIEINPKEPRYLKVVWGIGYKIERQ